MDTQMPYLVIPKLIVQPTWGGDYIAQFKKWNQISDLENLKLGQSYELFSGSNLSLLTSTEDEQFKGEITDSEGVKKETSPPKSISLTNLISQNAENILGAEIIEKYGSTMHLLIKFTQALGNSFQLHVPDGTKSDRWLPKPESWYYFEPGYITLGVKQDIDWQAYQDAVTKLYIEIKKISDQVSSKSISIEQAKEQVASLVKKYDPWQYVNTFAVGKDELIDLSPCGIHHSWEEHDELAPNGNILYELQLDVLDSKCTIRNFDKGKIKDDGSIRELHVDDYFRYIDRSKEANDPQTHLLEASEVAHTDGMHHDRLLESQYYTLDKVTLDKKHASFVDRIETFRHVFVKSGFITLKSGNTELEITQGHAAFIPAAAEEYEIESQEPSSTVLISY